jgi:hypothetical protein
MNPNDQIKKDIDKYEALAADHFRLAYQYKDAADKLRAVMESMQPIGQSIPTEHKSRRGREDETTPAIVDVLLETRNAPKRAADIVRLLTKHGGKEYSQPVVHNALNRGKGTLFTESDKLWSLIGSAREQELQKRKQKVDAFRATNSTAQTADIAAHTGILVVTVNAILDGQI